MVSNQVNQAASAVNKQHCLMMQSVLQDISNQLGLGLTSEVISEDVAEEKWAQLLDPFFAAACRERDIRIAGLERRIVDLARIFSVDQSECSGWKQVADLIVLRAEHTMRRLETCIKTIAAESEIKE